MSEEALRREPRPRPRAAPRPAGVFARDVLGALWSPVRRVWRSLRNRDPGRTGVEKAPRWRHSRPSTVLVRTFTLLGGALLLFVVGRATYIVFGGDPTEWPWWFNPDGGCRDIGYSCGVASSILMTMLTLGFAGTFFLVTRLWAVRRPYVRSAERDTKTLVQTAGTIIGDVVGRDEVCHVIIDDLKLRSSRRPHLVLGGVGTGKTAVLFRLTKLLAEKRAVPVPIRIADGNGRLDFEELAKKRFVSEVVTSSLSDLEGERVWRQLRKDDQIVVLADGFDEALSAEGDLEAQSDDAARDRDNQARLAIREAHRRKLPLVIASRPHGALNGLDAAVVELEPLGEEAALEYLEGGAARRDEHRLDWVIETAEVTETPFYLQIAHELNEAGLLGHAAPVEEEDILDTRKVDRAALRVGLLGTWTRALELGHFEPQLPMTRKLRRATIAQMSALACMGLKLDRLDVPFAELFAPASGTRYRYRGLIDHLKASIGEVLKVENSRLKEEKVNIEREVRLAAARAAQLRLVEPIADGVRFPHSIMQSYLASRVLGRAIDDDGEYLNDALSRSGRELLLALVMFSRKPRPSMGDRQKMADIRTRLKEEGCRSDVGTAKALEILVAALEIDAATDEPIHGELAAALEDKWPELSEEPTVEDTKLRAIGRFGATMRRVAERPGVEPAYRQLHEIARKDLSYRVRLAATQELGTGGDRAIAVLVGCSPDATAGARAEAVRVALGPPAGDDWMDEEMHRHYLVRAWLAPMLVGSVRRYKDAARANLAHWVRMVAPARDRDPLPVSLEIALAQGFKHAANRRAQHPHARDDSRSHLAERAAAMLEDASFWYSRLTLVQALCLWALPPTPGAPNRTAKRARKALLTRGRGEGPAGRGSDPQALVGHWLESRVRGKEHPFVAEARDLAVLALERRQPERFLWIDEAGVATKIGARPPRSDVVRRHNLWIPPSAGWSALHPRAQQLVADVLLLMNLVERGDDPEERERRFRRALHEDLPPCLAGQRKYLDPGRTVGNVDKPAPGASCKHGCHFDLCPYPPKGSQPYRVELSEAFCRRQQVLLSFSLYPGRRTARWQGATKRQLKKFWIEMEERARR